MSKYGFEDEEAPIELPQAPATPKPRPAADATQAAIEEGRGLGFVSREATIHRKPGRRKIEPTSRVLVSGPTRVLDAFKAHCEAQNVTYWQALEEWMNAQQSNKN